MRGFWCLFFWHELNVWRVDDFKMSITRRWLFVVHSESDLYEETENKHDRGVNWSALVSSESLKTNLSCRTHKKKKGREIIYVFFFDGWQVDMSRWYLLHTVPSSEKQPETAPTQRRQNIYIYGIMSVFRERSVKTTPDLLLDGRRFLYGPKRRESKLLQVSDETEKRHST